MKKRRVKTIVFQTALALMLLLFAFGASRALRAAGADHGNEGLLAEYEALQSNLDAMSERYLALQAANDGLVAKRDELLGLLGNPDKNPDVVRAWQDAARLAGMTDVRGAGLKLQLQDKQNYNPLLDPVESLVHDKTLLHILTLLADHGAAAMSVNNIRLTAVPQIYCIGPTILCNIHRLAPPYEINVIGDAAALAGALAGDAWLQRLLSPQIGVRLKAEASTDVLVPSFAASGDYLKQITLLEGP